MRFPELSANPAGPSFGSTGPSSGFAFGAPSGPSTGGFNFGGASQASAGPSTFSFGSSVGGGVGGAPAFGANNAPTASGEFFFFFIYFSKDRSFCKISYRLETVNLY